MKTYMRTLFLVAAAGLLTVTQLVPSATAASPVDTVLSKSTCSFLGRLYDTTQDGCSRSLCAKSTDTITGGKNAEVCRTGMNKYANVVDYRTCAALHRMWFSNVNYCASNAKRTSAVIANAPQCIAPYTTYVNHTEEEGNYDECYTPERVQEFTAIAAEEGRTVSYVSSVRSETLCLLRPNRVFVDGKCSPSSTPVNRDAAAGTLMIGDSITWRGTNELGMLMPSWHIDGYPGRTVSQLQIRINTYLEGHTQPEMLVIALGTNPSTGWTKQSYLDVIDSLPMTQKIMFVTPYRAGNFEIAQQVTVYDQWMREIAHERSNVCLADWRAMARADPSLLVDGVHQTRASELTWARLLRESYNTCTTIQ